MNNKQEIREEQVELVRSSKLLMANANKKLSDTQKNLLLYTIFKSNGRQEFTMSASEFAKEMNIDWNKRQVDKDTDKLLELGFSVFDKEFIADKGFLGEFVKLSMFDKFHYKNGNIIVKFGSSIYEELLSPVDFALSMEFESSKNLTASGQILYDLLLLCSDSDFEIGYDSLKIAYKASGKTYDNFGAFDRRYLRPAIENVGEFTEFKITPNDVEKIKTGRKISSIRIPIPSIPEQYKATDKQLELLRVLKQELKENITFFKTEGADVGYAERTVKDFEAQVTSGKMNRLTKRSAENLISLMFSIRDNLRAVAETIEGEYKFQSEIYRQYNLQNSPEFKTAVDYFEKFFLSLPFATQPTQADRAKLREYLLSFEGQEEEILDVVLDIIMTNRATSYNYIYGLFDEWLANNITTAYKALKYHERHYGKTRGQEPLMEMSDDLRIVLESGIFSS